MSACTVEWMHSTEWLNGLGVDCCRLPPHLLTPRGLLALPTHPSCSCSISETCGGGLVFWHPKGAMVRGCRRRRCCSALRACQPTDPTARRLPSGFSSLAPLGLFISSPPPQVRHLIEGFWKDIHLSSGYQLLYTPHIAKASCCCSSARDRSSRVFASRAAPVPCWRRPGLLPPRRRPRPPPACRLALADPPHSSPPVLHCTAGGPVEDERAL